VHTTTISPILRILIVIGLLSLVSQGRLMDEQPDWRLPSRGCKPIRSILLSKRQVFWGTWKSYCWRRRQSWVVPLLRSLLLWGLWQASGQVGSDWLQLLPWLIWLLPVGRVKQSLEWVQRVLIIGYAVLSLGHLSRALGLQISGGEGVLLGCVACAEKEPKVEVIQTEDGNWQAILSGRFSVQVSSDHPFRLRMLLIFLGLLQSDNDQRRSRRTRDGRTPFVRQEQLAAWTNTKQEHISRWTQWWLKSDWANLLSLKTAEVLTADLVERIVTVCATFPNWTAEEVYRHLRQQGLKVSQSQVEQACQASGWKQAQSTLRQRFDLKAGFHLRDEWLVDQLLRLVQTLLVKMETTGGLTPEERWTAHDLQTLSTQAGVMAEPPLPVQPWLQAMEGCLLGTWEQVSDAAIRCPGCGSTDVAPKSKKPRQKKFYDAQGQLQSVDVYRYYCHNPQCTQQSFTHLPAGLVPYSPYRTQMHLLAIQMYAWGYSTYRRTGSALGVYSMTAYRWVSALGHDLLPVAALFGLVKSSGVVGVDEKFVLVPKNDKPAGDMRRWMYVYLAVDAWTYDLLHIAIYPYNNDRSAKAFLLALRAKGYHPQIFVTDLRQDYGPLIAQVFPDAQHHECIFHAQQNIQKYIRDVYGPDYAEKHPEAALLKQQIYAIFDSLSSSEAYARYQEVLSLKTPYLLATPASLSIFDFLERHWPKLVNAIGSDTIPTTNNVTELVIRRFDQHYQNFCGFESIYSANTFLAVFEKLYRFTPFSDDAQPRIRGKSPLQLAGYNVSQFPLSTICSGLSVVWPSELSLVPN
jgi:hypothetical protein